MPKKCSMYKHDNYNKFKTIKNLLYKISTNFKNMATLQLTNTINIAAISNLAVPGLTEWILIKVPH